MDEVAADVVVVVADDEVAVVDLVVLVVAPAVEVAVDLVDVVAAEPVVAVEVAQVDVVVAELVVAVEVATADADYHVVDAVAVATVVHDLYLQLHLLRVH